MLPRSYLSILRPRRTGVPRKAKRGLPGRSQGDPRKVRLGPACANGLRDLESKCPLANMSGDVRKQDLEPGDVATLARLLRSPAARGAAGIPEHLLSLGLRAVPAARGGDAATRGPVAPASIAGAWGGGALPIPAGHWRHPFGSGRARRQGWGGAAGRAGAGAGQGRAGPLRGGRSARSTALAPKVCEAPAMRTLWMALCALARLWPGALGGCADAGRCCPGRDPACFASGWRLDRVYGTCFCDQACRLTGDCCFDYARACPGGWRGAEGGEPAVLQPAAKGQRVAHQTEAQSQASAAPLSRSTPGPSNEVHLTPSILGPSCPL